MTPAELALLGLAPGDLLPVGGRVYLLEARSGTGTSQYWLNVFGPLLQARYGVSFHPGSLNLWHVDPIELEHPLLLRGNNHDGYFAPVILDEIAIGIALKHSCSEPKFLEVFSPVQLRTRLGGLEDRGHVPVRLLAGSELATIGPTGA